MKSLFGLTLSHRSSPFSAERKTTQDSLAEGLEQNDAPRLRFAQTQVCIFGSRLIHFVTQRRQEHHPAAGYLLIFLGALRSSSS